MRTQHWAEFAQAAPKLAERGTWLLYQDAAVASAFLATVAPDQRPRLHPVSPALALDELWLFIVDLSPKFRDLEHNPGFALHTLPTPAGGEEFYIRGQVEVIRDRARRQAVAGHVGTGQGAHDFEVLCRCELQCVLYTRWTDWGTEQAWPHYEKWFA